VTIAVKARQREVHRGVITARRAGADVVQGEAHVLPTLVGMAILTEARGALTHDTLDLRTDA
jgi:hypothetical protein